MNNKSRSKTTPVSSLTILLSVLVFASSFVDSAAHAASASDDISEIRAPLLKDFDAPQFGAFKVIGGIKSSQTAGRGEEFADPSGRRFKLKTEYYLGGLHASGWGVSAMAVTSGSSYGDDKRTHFGAGDPSLTLAHPAIYEDANLKVTGQLREYFPVADMSVDRNQHQTAYYLVSTYQMGRGYALMNAAIPRYFLQAYYKDNDTTAYFEDYTTLSKTMSRWLRVGMGAHSQLERHQVTASGSCIEIYPYASLIVSKNIFIEPRVYLPVHKVNEVYDTPRAVALNNYQAEIFAQMSL